MLAGPAMIGPNAQDDEVVDTPVRSSE